MPEFCHQEYFFLQGVHKEMPHIYANKGQDQDRAMLNSCSS